MPDSTGADERVSLVMSLRKRGIGNVDVLRAMELVPREAFVHKAFIDQAYYDIALPIDCGQTISQPFVVAYMTELLSVGKQDKVLEIGTGSGYQAAVLSHLCSRVFTIEAHRDLVVKARQKFNQLKLDNIVTRAGDGSVGWPEQALFERIIVTAAATQVPQPLLEQLAYGGRLVMPVGSNRETQKIILVERTNNGYESEESLSVRFVPLISATDEE